MLEMGKKRSETRLGSFTPLCCESRGDSNVNGFYHPFHLQNTEVVGRAVFEIIRYGREGHRTIGASITGFLRA